MQTRIFPLSGIIGLLQKDTGAGCTNSLRAGALSTALTSTIGGLLAPIGIAIELAPGILAAGIQAEARAGSCRKLVIHAELSQTRAP